MGRVRNIIVSDRELFEEELILGLIKNEISYVKIEHEFHFLDQIYRFYDSEDLHVISLYSMPAIEYKKDKLFLNFVNESIEYLPSDNCNDLKTERKFEKVNKRMLKANNRQVNRIINKN